MLTLNLHKDIVVAVLDALLDLTAVVSSVIGAELRYLDACICGCDGVAHHVDPVQVVLIHTHTSLQGHQDGPDFVLGDVAPFDAVGERRDGGGPWVGHCVIL